MLRTRHINGHLQPIGFFSVRLTPTQQNYSTYDGELLVAHSIITPFPMLVGGSALNSLFSLITNHSRSLFIKRWKKNLLHNTNIWSTSHSSQWLSNTYLEKITLSMMRCREGMNWKYAHKLITKP
ncbi:hypothetical protein CDAR_427681 [Caerostris darwini]|uniref:Reverse transcriptase RNase H-like domain-containing protein n=1 Tax=Caerostris darwini TaxID=1538125 RepID=A0AAV4MBF2_9ARAC|nr:hypothetical protein CDAR_427681 [Caerostris darwini]